MIPVLRPLGRRVKKSTSDLKVGVPETLRSLMYFVLFFSLTACEKRLPAKVFPAFYHWQTHLQLTDNERLHLDSLGAKKLYVKFFDVDWDETTQQPVPLAQIEMDTARLAGLDIVPTIFITNRTLLYLPLEQTDSLAGRIFQKIQALAQPANFAFREFQFDCDWSEQTKEKYFRLLTSFRQKTGSTKSQIPNPKSQIPNPKSQITATIRLHQVKFFEKTGVPPVDRGMLMFYNMGDLEDWQTENSILDLEAAGKYFSPDHFGDYPLPLDVALPLFRWGVLFRDGELIKLIPNLQRIDLQDSLRFEKTDEHRFAAKKNTYLQGIYLYSGDQIRLEQVTPGQLKQATQLLQSHVNNSRKSVVPDLTIAFYHLDTFNMKAFPAAILKNVVGKWDAF